MNEFKNVKDLINDWLLGMIIASFSFSAGFVIRLEREKISDEKPNVLYLDIKAAARSGDKASWEKLVASLPYKARRGEVDEPALAYMIMLLVGSEITSVDLDDDGSISISIGTTDGETLYISGVDDVWDESWVLSEASEVCGENQRAVICSASGNLSVT
jgi:hypothetical protein